MSSWNDYFLEIADVAKKRSKDEQTKIGCVIVAQDNSILTTGYNSFPRGINDNVPERQLRPEKYYWFEHAERNAIYNAARRILAGSRIFVTMHPCPECARGIINSGISEVLVPNIEIPDRWKEQMSVSSQMLKEANVKVVIL